MSLEIDLHAVVRAAIEMAQIGPLVSFDARSIRVPSRPSCCPASAAAAGLGGCWAELTSAGMAFEGERERGPARGA
jgi:hypothetical protein